MSGDISIRQVRARGEITADQLQLVGVINPTDLGGQGLQPRPRHAGIVDPHHRVAGDGFWQLPASRAQSPGLLQLLQLQPVQWSCGGLPLPRGSVAVAA
jgi:hypothetical protein